MDFMYHRKAALCPVFLACRPLFRELHDAPVVAEAMMIRSFGHVPATCTPPVVPRNRLSALRPGEWLHASDYWASLLNALL